MNEQVQVNVWYDEAGDYLDVSWGKGNAYYTATGHDRVMALVDMEGNVLGFKIDGVSAVKGRPLNVDLRPVKPQTKTA
jgi:hypothetical protein